MERDLKELDLIAKQLRESVIKMLVAAGSGHSAGPLGSADFWTALYFSGVLNYRPTEPDWENRDRVILSAGHYAPILYAVLAEAGFFPKQEINSLRKIDSRLQGHPHFLVGNKDQLPGIENTSGPLGQGISIAVGMALAAKIDHEKWRVVCFMGDGEQDEGQVWEAYMLAAKEKLSNVTVIIDRNNIQLDGHTEAVMPLEPLKDKLLAFNLNVIEVDGHDMVQIIEAMKMSKIVTDRPTVIILRTIPGKGVSFMENKPDWHGRAPTAKEAIEAIYDLREITRLNDRNS